MVFKISRYNYFVIVIFLFTSHLCFGNHNQGATLSIKNIKDSLGNPTDNYRFVYIGYAQQPYDAVNTSYDLNIYRNGNNTILSTHTLLKKSIRYINHTTASCLPSDSLNLRAEVIYETEIINLSALNDTNGYYASVITTWDMPEPINYNRVLSQIPVITLEFAALGNTSIARYNSSPEFNIKPRLIYCVSNTVSQNWSAIDFDNDSLSYSISNIYYNNGVKPFTSLGFHPPYSNINILGNINLPFNIDNNGLANISLSSVGYYFVAYKVKEFRQSKLISEVTRFMVLTSALQCPSNLEPKLEFLTTNTNSLIDTVLLNDTIIHSFKASDLGVANDSLFIISDGFLLDSNYYTWEILNDSLQTVGIQRGDLSLNSKKYAYFNLLIHPDSNAIIGSMKSLKIIAYDNTCVIPKSDTINYQIIFKRNDYFVVSPTNAILKKGDSKSFIVKMTNDYGVQYQWQTDRGNGFVDIIESNKYRGSRNDTLTIYNVSNSNHEQTLRCISKGIFNNDTSLYATILLDDSCINYIIDSSYFIVYDTIYTINNDTVYLSSKDSIEISFLNANGSNSVLTALTTDSSNVCTLELNDISFLNGYYATIVDEVGNTIASFNFNQISFQLNINSLEAKKNHKLNIYNNQNQLIVDRNLYRIK